tara:strand:- start:628 stop:966 length:339 start_codon:yes stop_codon:yes gene_type:complete
MNVKDISSNTEYAEETFTFDDLQALPGDTLLDFGAPWCGHCQAARPAIDEVVSEHAGLRHMKIYDGKGKPLGRAFKVKLWPTLILLRAGNEVARLVRPLAPDEVRQLVSTIG